MDDEAKDKVLQMIRAAGVERGKRQDDQVHDIFDGHAEEETANDPIHF